MAEVIYANRHLDRQHLTHNGSTHKDYLKRLTGSYEEVGSQKPGNCYLQVEYVIMEVVVKNREKRRNIQSNL